MYAAQKKVNNIELALLYETDILAIPELISNSSFHITEETIQAIADRIMDYCKNNFYDFDEVKNTSQQLALKMIRSIVTKSTTNVEEYLQFGSYARLLQELVDKQILDYGKMTSKKQ